MVVVPHRCRIRGVEDYPRTHRCCVSIAEKLIVFLPMPCRVKSPDSSVRPARSIDQAARHVITPAIFSLTSLGFPPGFANGEQLAWHRYLAFGSYAERPPRVR